jgi:hypothetical protein
VPHGGFLPRNLRAINSFTPLANAMAKRTHPVGSVPDAKNWVKVTLSPDRTKRAAQPFVRPGRPTKMGFLGKIPQLPAVILRWPRVIVRELRVMAQKSDVIVRLPALIAQVPDLMTELPRFILQVPRLIE